MSKENKHWVLFTEVEGGPFKAIWVTTRQEALKILEQGYYLNRIWSLHIEEKIEFAFAIYVVAPHKGHDYVLKRLIKEGGTVLKSWRRY